MNYMLLFNFIRKWGSIACIAFFVGVFYGFLAAMFVKFMFHLPENEAILFVGVPVGLGFMVFMWPKLSKLLGFDRNV